MSPRTKSVQTTDGRREVEKRSLHETTDQKSLGELDISNQPKLIPADLPGPQPFLITPAGTAKGEDSAEWISTLYLNIGRQRCTGTLIGPQVLITAAHCVVGYPRFGIDLGDETIEILCESHPGYARRGMGSLFDFALCRLDKPFPSQITMDALVTQADVERALDSLPNDQFLDRVLFRERFLPLLGDPHRNAASLKKWLDEAKQSNQLCGKGAIRFSIHEVIHCKELLNLISAIDLTRDVPVRHEQLSLDARHVRLQLGNAASRYLLMSGYGCTARNEQGGNDANLRIGPGYISNFGTLWLTIGSPRRLDSAVLCKGDSGGPAFRLLGRDQDPYRGRRLVAINSHNEIVGGRVGNRSYVALTSSSAFASFFNSWRRKWRMPYVCGVDRPLRSFCHE